MMQAESEEPMKPHPTIPADDTPPLPPGEDPDIAALLPLLAAALAPIELAGGSEAALGARLFARVADSARANRAFHTVRGGDGSWRELAEGVRARLLDRSEGSHSALIEFEPGARLQGSERRLVRECLVLRGDLDIDGTALGPQDYHLAGADAQAACALSHDGALVYLRTNLPGKGVFGEVQHSLTISAAHAGWQPLRTGVRIRPLFKLGEHVSMLARFEPGARVPGHPHASHEECLMVEGELFLGDLLLREGEFQSAPAGSRHGDLVSDTGCLLFFHGMVDPSVTEDDA